MCFLRTGDGKNAWSRLMTRPATPKRAAPLINCDKLYFFMTVERLRSEVAFRMTRLEH